MFFTQSYKVVHDVCNYISKPTSCGCAPDQICEKVRILVDEILETYPHIVQMCDGLNVIEVGDTIQVQRVLEEVFSDGVVNWGRVLTAVAFGGILSLQCEERKIEGCLDAIPNHVTVFVVQRLGGWIVENGGWVGVAYIKLPTIYFTAYYYYYYYYLFGYVDIYM